MSQQKKQNQHVVQRGDGWAVRGEGDDHDTVRTDTQREAIARATEIARQQGAEVLIHGRDGRIRERSSYGNDPYPPKG